MRSRTGAHDFHAGDLCSISLHYMPPQYSPPQHCDLKHHWIGSQKPSQMKLNNRLTIKGNKTCVSVLYVNGKLPHHILWLQITTLWLVTVSADFMRDLGISLSHSSNPSTAYHSLKHCQELFPEHRDSLKADEVSFLFDMLCFLYLGATCDSASFLTGATWERRRLEVPKADANMMTLGWAMIGTKTNLETSQGFLCEDWASW